MGGMPATNRRDAVHGTANPLQPRPPVKSLQTHIERRHEPLTEEESRELHKLLQDEAAHLSHPRISRAT
jgi:hypothetical protein